MTSDESTLVVGSFMQLEILKKNGSAYVLHQTIFESEASFEMKLSGDGKELISGSHSLNIYLDNGTHFVLSQTLSLGFFCMGIRSINGLLQAYGDSLEIRFYEPTTSGYSLKYTILTNEPYIQEISVLEDGNKMMLGGPSENLSEYTLNAGTFELTQQLETSSPMLGIFVDPN